MNASIIFKPLERAAMISLVCRESGDQLYALIDLGDVRDLVRDGERTLDLASNGTRNLIREDRG